MLSTAAHSVSPSGGASSGSPSAGPGSGAGGVDGGQQKPNDNNKEPRAKRKKARRACFSCQRAHLTCGMAISISSSIPLKTNDASVVFFGGNRTNVLPSMLTKFPQGMSGLAIDVFSET